MTDPRPTAPPIDNEFVAPGCELFASPQKVPTPRPTPLPLGGNAPMYTRENLTQLYRCSHGELGRLLSRKMAPLPIRLDGAILWFVDEALGQQAQVIRTLERWRR
jgi:hypothetical protein